ncbi:MAG: NAD(+)/NADH kinase [Deltaproteobacteria bacterium]|nr:NAD(+)/NADH kinase [Deltaproteobacteria bacterium]
MKSVGIIANPASGKDIRRLVAFGTVFDNNEKVNIVRRLLLAMDAVGVDKVYYMPDSFHIGERALDAIEVALQADRLDMMVEDTQDDSTLAAELLSALDVACIITLGGDGTNRAVAKKSGDTPLLPISTGTNNVFPFMVEGTLAGLAAGTLALNTISVEEVTRREPRLEIYRGSDLVDIALIDVVVTKSAFVGARAVWDVSEIHEIFLTRSGPSNIGFSSVGGYLCPLPAGCGKGLHIVIGDGKRKVKTPIAPGLVCSLPIKSHRVFGEDEAIPISQVPSLIALDGEREISARQGDALSVRINPRGPVVVDIDRVLQQACERSLFVSDDHDGS